MKSTMDTPGRALAQRAIEAAAIESGVLGEIAITHSTRADQRDDSVLVESTTNDWSRRSDKRSSSIASWCPGSYPWITHDHPFVRSTSSNNSNRFNSTSEFEQRDRS